jgi:hypothetical protein
VKVDDILNVTATWVKKAWDRLTKKKNDQMHTKNDKRHSISHGDNEEKKFQIGDLVKISCTCGASHDEDPLHGIVLEDDDGGFVKIYVKEKSVWMWAGELENESR